MNAIIGSGDEGALQEGVANRLTGDTGQVAVKYMRIAMPALTWLLGMAGAWVYWKRRRDLVPIGLAVVPAQAYRSTSDTPVAQGAEGLLFYLIAYGAMTVGAFAVLAYLDSPARRVETVFALEPHYVRPSEVERNPKFPPLPDVPPVARIRED